jgi:hypothetical protein
LPKTRLKALSLPSHAMPAGAHFANPMSKKTLGEDDPDLGRVFMTMQERKDHGLANNFWLQMGLIAVVAVIVIMLAAKYVW